MPAATYLYPNITIFVEILFIIFGDGGFSGVLVEGGGDIFGSGGISWGFWGLGGISWGLGGIFWG